MDYNAIAQQLIDAVTAASDASLKSLGTQRRNEFAGINNVNNSRGTLYSTQGGYQKNKFDASKYLPAVAAEKQKPLLTKLAVSGQATEATRAIDAMNRAAAELNGIVFDY